VDPSAVTASCTPDGSEPRSASVRRVEVASEFLLDRPTLLLPLSAQFAEGVSTFESTIRGSSMEPAIPARARVRVDLVGSESCGAGDIVFFLTDDDDYVVHRVVRTAHSGSTIPYVFTYGDNCYAADAPVLSTRVVGRVSAFEGADGWCPPGPLVPGSPFKRATRWAMTGAMSGALRFGPSHAKRLERAGRVLEDLGRYQWRRVIRRIRRLVHR
jgi:hypothetical protein